MFSFLMGGALLNVRSKSVQVDEYHLIQPALGGKINGTEAVHFTEGVNHHQWP